MHFHIDDDQGTYLCGWIVPDNPSQTPRVLVCLPDREPIEIEAFLHRSDIVEGGLHSTGIVGFIIDETRVPNLSREKEVELREAETRVLIYKRFNIDQHIERKLMLFDAGIMPQRRIYNNLSAHFAMPYNFIERLAFETIWAIILNTAHKSVVLTGRPHYMRYSSTLSDANYVVAALLRNPFEELAERLIFLNMITKSKASSVLTTFATGLHSVIEFTRDFPFYNDRLMSNAIRQASIEQRDALRNPLTRMLACNVDEKAERRHVSTALENLAGMNIVATRTRFAEFKAVATELLGADVFGDSSFEESPLVSELAEKLGRISIVQDLLEHDLALYSFAEEAIDTGLAPPSPEAA